MQQNISGSDAPGTVKAEFKNAARANLKRLAAAIYLLPWEYDLRWNRGGIAVSGEVTLHSDNIYVQLSQGSLSGFCGYARSVKSRKDYTGGNNNWLRVEEFSDMHTLAQKILRIAHEGERVHMVEHHLPPVSMHR